MKLADYVMQRLALEGIDTAFVVDGAAAADLIHAVPRAGMKYVCMLQEQGAGFAAEGYAKVKGLGLAVATSGPGGQNLVTPIANCYYDSTPCVFITGQVRTPFMMKDDLVRQKGFQETPISDIVAPITKWSWCVIEPMSIYSVLETAITTAKSGRPGPVLIDIPIDVQKAEVPYTPELNVSYEEVPDLEYDLQQIIRLLNAAEKPMFLVGGGARGCEDLIHNIALQLGIPCVPTWNALDIITSDSPIYAGRVGTYGGPGYNKAIQECDFLLCLGTRVSGRITGGNPKSFAPQARKILVNIDQHMTLDHDVKFDFVVPAPCLAFLEQWQKLLDVKHDFTSWLEQCIKWRNELDTYNPAPYAAVRRLAAKVPNDAIIVGDAGGNLVMMSQAFATKKGQRFFSSNGNSPIGFSMCGAIGAHFAAPHRPVLCVIGDGGFVVNSQELAVIAHHELNIEIVVIDNAGYGITEAYQKANLGRAIACNPETGLPCPVPEDIAHAYNVPISSILCPNFHDYRPRMARGDGPIDELIV